MKLALGITAALCIVQCTTAFLPSTVTSCLQAQHRQTGATTSRPALTVQGASKVKSEDADQLVEAKIVVTGQAYGGYFRAHARNEAHFMRSLTGALQEFPDRTEIIVEGKKGAIESFVRWCRRGPGLSQQIDLVSVTFSDYVGIFDGFNVMPDQQVDVGNHTAGKP